MMIRTLATALSCATALWVHAAQAQPYPTKPLRILVGFSPGGASDITTRIIGQKLSEAFGQPVVTDNRAGASGAIAARIVAQSAPDGYTLLSGATSILALNPAMLAKPGYDSIKDFTPVSQTVSMPQALVVHPSVKAATLKELIALAKARPGELNYSSSGSGSSSHLAIELLKFMTGINLVHVPFKGSGQSMPALLAGQVQKTRHYDYVLTAAEKNAGVVLMCCNTAAVDLVIEAREAHGVLDIPLQNIAAKVKSVDLLADDMRLLRLQTPRSNRLRFLAGQSVALTLDGGATADFSVASCPCDDRNLEFHVARRPGDAFCDGVFTGLSGADTVRVEGPRGDFVLNETSARPLVFIAYGGGFAPVKSLIEHAMALDVAETLQLYWMADGKSGHYLNNLCRSWADALDNFRYIPLTVDHDPTQDAAMRDALARVLPAQAELAGHDVYVAGAESFTNEAEYLLLDCGLPRAQLLVNRLPAA